MGSKNSNKKSKIPVIIPIEIKNTAIISIKNEKSRKKYL